MNEAVDFAGLSTRVRAETYRRFASLRLPAEAELDVDRALRAAGLPGQRVLFEAAADASLPPALAIQRLASLWSLSAAINLMDDISDGDCDYLPLPAAPGTVVLLQSLATMLALAGQVEPQALAVHAEGILRMAAGQNVEVRTATWSAENYLHIAQQVAGAQYAAHLALLWSGTQLSALAEPLGNALGTIGMIAKDAISFDPRLLKLTLRERRELAAWAQRELSECKTRQLKCVEALARYAEPALCALGS